MMRTKVVIKPCAVGYGVYDVPYHWLGEKIESLYLTSKTIDDCIEYCKEQGFEYRIEDSNSNE